jgi:tripartite-type tricarboxylate transporter receptor subunit TctC
LKEHDLFRKPVSTFRDHALEQEIVVMRTLTLVGLGLVAATAAGAQSAPDAAADFYRGKTLTVVVGHEAGTGYDFFGRTLARFISKHMAGNPSTITQNMPGAGGLKAANWLASVAPKDGLVISVFAPETALKPIFGDAAANFDPAKFTWIGNMDESIATCAVSTQSGITSLDQLRTRDAVFGATGAAAPTSKFAYALINFMGARIKVVQGYKGSNDLRIAVNRDEVEGACGMSHSTLKTQWKDDIDSGRVRTLAQFGMKKSPDLAGVAHIYDYARSDEDRAIFDLAFGPHVLGRPVIAPPDVPAERARALRSAFLLTMQDPELQAEVQKHGLSIAPASGEEVEALVARFAAAPQNLIEKATAGLHEKR